MTTISSAISRRLRAGVALRALAAGSASPGDFQSSSNPGALIGTRYCSRSLTAAFAALGLMVVTPTSSSHAQVAPPLGTTADFAILSGAGITNTGPSVITGIPAHPGDLGSTTATITGFPPGIVTAPGVIHAINDGPTITAQGNLTTAYNNLAGRTTTVDLSGQNLGGLTLVPGVYNFATSAQLTGALRLNGLGNPSSVFIFNIGSTLTTASASAVSLINAAQGGNVFWRVGSSATLGTSTSFAGDILAQTSITLNTSATITCGAAWARTGAVTLDTNTISLCALLTGTGGTVVLPDGSVVLPDGTSVLPDGTVIRTVLGPTGFPLFASLLPSSADRSQRAVATGLDTSISNGVTLPLAFVNLFNLTPTNLASAFSQLQGEAGTGTAQAGTQAMNSFLSLVTNPFADNRGDVPESMTPPRPAPVYKAPVYKAPVYNALSGGDPDPRRWGAWASAFGSQNKTTGDPVVTGSHDRSARTFGYAIGLDYRVTPYTVAGFALAGGGTNFGLAGGFGGGRSDTLQSSVYSMTRYNDAYVSAALAYAWHRVSTERILTVAGTDDLTARFSANNVGGRIEGGYRFAIPGVFGLPGFGLTPYGAYQVQAFRTPSYSEIATSGASVFALAYSARTTTTTRTELGAWFDGSIALDGGAILALRSRTAWAHDHWSDPSITATFLSLPGSSFNEFGAAPARDSLLSSNVVEISLKNGFSLAGKFDAELAKRSRTYTGTARLRYTF